MSREAFVLWRDDAYGYVDVIPEDRLRHSGTAFEHPVFGPEGNLYGKAKCRVEVGRDEVHLDYGGEFQNANENAGMDIGVMCLRFGEHKLITVLWKAVNARDFEAARAVALWDKELDPLCVIRRKLAST